MKLLTGDEKRERDRLRQKRWIEENRKRYIKRRRAYYKANAEELRAIERERHRKRKAAKSK
jgi:hypothetical protein